MEWLLHDLRFSIRTLLKTPGFTFAAVLILALAIGVNTSVFSIVNAVLIRPLPFKDPGSLVMVWEKNLEKGVSQEYISPANLIDWQNQSQVFEATAAFDTSTYTLTGVDEPERISGSRVMTNLFSLLGVTPFKGRLFIDGDGQSNHDQIVVIGYDLWQRRFGGDPNLVGKVIKLNNQPHEVIGIMPPDFDFPKWFESADSNTRLQAELWTPLVFSHDDLSARGGRFLSVIARLKPGLSAEQAQQSLKPLIDELSRKFEENQGYEVVIIPLQEQVVGKVRKGLLIFFLAIGIVLMIACTNIANLMLVRATARRKEIAIRLSLGCSRVRLLRQLLTESLLLAMIGGLAGIPIAIWGLNIFRTYTPEMIPRPDEIFIDMNVLGFTAGIAVLTGIIFGLIPAIQSLRPGFTESLKESGHSAGDSPRHNKMRSILAVLEVAMTLVLLIGAGLLIRSFLRLVSVQPGYNFNNVAAMRLVLPQSKYARGEQSAAFFRDLNDRVKYLPGVKSVALTTNLPLSGTNMTFRYRIDGRSAPATEILLAEYHAISANYFHTLSIKLIEGRDFSEYDTAESPPVIIINQALARRAFKDENPIGKKLMINYGKQVPREVVGVVNNIKHKGLDTEAQEEVYVPYLQNPWAFMTLVVFTNSDPKHMIGALKNAVRVIDKDQPIENIKTGEQLIGDVVLRPRFYALILGILSGLAMILATSGVYSVISYSALQRRHEFGIRLALGAETSDILMLVLRQAMIVALIGILIGLSTAYLIMRLISMFLYGVGVADPPTYLFSSLLMIATVMIASYLPARRMAGVDPASALRYE